MDPVPELLSHETLSVAGLATARRIHSRKSAFKMLLLTGLEQRLPEDGFSWFDCGLIIQVRHCAEASDAALFLVTETTFEVDNLSAGHPSLAAAP